MSEEKANSSAVESLAISEECKIDVQQLHGVVQRRVEKVPRPLKGYLTRIPPVYGCDMLAAHSIACASKESSTAFSANVEHYTWNIVIFFRGNPTIGSTPTLMIPIVAIGDLTVRVGGRDNEMATLGMAGQYHIFHREHTLNIDGDGLLAALCVTRME
ncbi:hypothetical protein BDV26DRAFT_250932 [Aspergillus bertholletiae]|uniref:Uncharacterized protein n=1 Tax=Aspergillus bertholletiae TaxID=1226010 RepID=A0A5N7BQ09_9EURO|nr:hypothetical protein BDV26DRAFT_250932 [Aspergillus bertholletiae]